MQRRFNYDFEFPSIDIRETYGFQITAFPPARPRYESLKRCFNKGDLIFYEDKQGVYHLERMSSPIETKVILSPNPWETQTKRCEITITYIALGFKYNPRREVVDFASAISSRIHRWKHEIVWFTDDGKKIIWKNTKKNSCTNTFSCWVT